MENVAYQPVRDNVDVDSENLNSEKHNEKLNTSGHKSWKWFSIVIWIAVGYSLAFITVAFLHPYTKESCGRESSAWSPALEIYDDDKFSTQRFNGALRAQNEFRGQPSQEIDDAWDEILHPEGGLVRLSKEQIDKVKASEYAAEYTEDMGGGYIGSIEALHQLHCLNMLRQVTYLDYYLPKKKEWRDDPQTLRFHLDHCIDMIRQKLMCSPDVGIITYVWAKGYKHPFPDFNIIHKCRDYSRLLEWVKENDVHGRNVSDLQRVPGAKERETRP
ncbi:Protein of unknown function DUF3328 [Penicillium expansum]|nr:Protein of unknown function DUF3328 [Penicillium expansum]